MIGYHDIDRVITQAANSTRVATLTSFPVGKDGEPYELRINLGKGGETAVMIVKEYGADFVAMDPYTATQIAQLAKIAVQAKSLLQHGKALPWSGRDGKECAVYVTEENMACDCGLDVILAKYKELEDT